MFKIKFGFYNGKRMEDESEWLRYDSDVIEMGYLGGDVIGI